MTTAFIRRATPADAEAIHTAHMQSIREVCSIDHSPEEIQAWGHRTFKEQQTINAINHDFVWVVENQGVVEGFGHFKIFFQDDIYIGHIFGLYLTAKMVGQGFGKELFELMLTEAKIAGVYGITLDSTITAHGFYKQIGFVDAGPQSFVEINGQPIRCYPMKMVLPSASFPR